MAGTVFGTIMSNHALTKSDVDLANVDNTSDANKPVSTATQTALDGKVPTTRTVNAHALTSDVTVSKSDVGLGDVDNTSDANKPVSTATQTAINAKQPNIQFKDDGTDKGSAGGITSVNFTGAGVTASDTGAALTVSIPGGAGEAFPVGSVFIAVVSTDPATLLGYGTWAAFGAGRVLIGLDSGDTDFDTVEETGGAKTKAISAHAGTAVADHAAHTHSVTSNVSVDDHASHTHTYTQVPNHVHVQTLPSTQAGNFACGTRDTTSGGTGGTPGTVADALSTANPTGGVATGTTAGPSATLAHTVNNPAVTSGNPSATLTHSVTQPSAHSDLSVVQPYIVVYMWKRTA